MEYKEKVIEYINTLINEEESQGPFLGDEEGLWEMKSRVSLLTKVRDGIKNLDT